VTVLSIIQNSCQRLSLVQPSTVTGSTDRQVQQLFGLLNQTGHDLHNDLNWSDLMTEFTFTTVNSDVQPVALPADMERPIPNTFFNRSTRRGVLGPITPQRWQAIKAQPIFNVVYLSWRKRTGQFLMTPTPPAGQTIAFEYISKNWATGAVGQPDPGPKAAFTQDTDTSVFEEEMLTLGVIWRFLRAKGLDYAEELKDYEAQKEAKSAEEAGATRISMTPYPIDPMRINLPDGNFGVPY
jgi:hypothetical protein